MDRERARRVAVVAVHGVGHHEPREAARAGADLLAASAPASYSPFVESPLRIPVSKLEVGAAPQRPKDLMHAFDERANFLREAHESHAPAPAPELQYMREQLSGYEPTGSDHIYDTIVVSATRTDPQGAPPVHVHVFDMYWTDLSRLSTAGVRFIGELYQLLFYVCGLGRKTLDFACAAYGNGRAWKSLAFCQRHAERLLVLYIPILNLCALGLGVLVVPQKLYDLESPFAISLATTAIVVLLTLGTTVLVRRFRPGPWWPGLFWVVLAIAAALGELLPWIAGRYMPQVLAEGCWLLVSAAIVALMAIYDKRRPGARLVAIVSVLGVAGMLLCPVVTRDVGENVQEIGLRAGKWLYVILHYLWVAFIVLAFAVSVLGYFAAMRTRGDADQLSAARRCAWTANLSLALPGLLVLLLNLALWRAVLKLAESFIDPPVVGKIAALLDESTPWSFVAILALTALAFVAVVWSVLPSLMGEMFPREAAKAEPAPLGVELSQAFVSMRAAGEVVRWIVVLALPATYVLQPWIPPAVVEWLTPLSRDYTVWIGLALVAMVAGPGPLRALALGLRTAIDIAVDIANWLRLYPLKENPRARICSRFASLLGHILAWRDPADQRGFDAIVILAHSQGTVISAELLRFLRLESHPLAHALAKIPVRLFTMGCPLRQLYSQRFPHQYGWARRTDAKWPGARPDPDELVVATWMNAYRSGDYVGRYLWHPDGSADAWTQVPFRQGKREEICIGAGAHTHYWDDTAPTIAAKLDELVCR